MKRLLLFVLTTGVALLSGIVEAQELDLEAFDRYARASFDAYQVPGAAVAIVKDGKVALSRGYGLRELGAPELVDEDTLFAIGSCTKAYTAALVAILVDEGKLGWNDRIIDHLPDFQLHDPYATREMRVRDLLSHKAGFASGDGDLLWLRSTYTREEILHRIRFVPPAYGFRERYGYSNVMFIIAGELVEAVSGVSWDEFLETRIFGPAGMPHANTSLREKTPGANWATPHVFFDGAIRPIVAENVDNLGGAGAVNASASDAARWLLLLTGRGAIGETRVFSEDAALEMWSVHTALGTGRAPSNPALAARHPSFAGYGLGWRLRDYRGRKIVFHGGGLAGMTSMTTVVPEENLGIMVLTSQETSVQTALTYWVMDSYFGAPRTDWTAVQREAAEARWRRLEPRLKAIDASRIPGTSPSLAPSAYAGHYRDAYYGDATVDYDGSELRLRFSKSPAFDARLDHWHFDTFVARFEHHSIADAFVTFAIGADGTITGVSMQPYSPTADSSYDYENLAFVPMRDEP